jgi:queuine tRNA-ribosyltransferase
MEFTLYKTSGMARRGQVALAHGNVQTPAFMPVGTYGTVKAMSPAELKDIDAHIVLGNTFHLWLRPGLEVIAAHGGLHKFMGWDGPILTDSGGVQVFSLGELRKFPGGGVEFRSPVNGDKCFLSPEESMRIQRVVNSDILMIFDECTPYPADERVAGESMRMSLGWAERSKRAHEGNPNALFGIVQGGMHEHLRDESLAGLTGIRICQRAATFRFCPSSSRMRTSIAASLSAYGFFASSNRSGKRCSSHWPTAIDTPTLSRKLFCGDLQAL